MLSKKDAKQQEKVDPQEAGDEAGWDQAMEVEETSRTDEPLDLSMIQAFGTPREPRTMAKLREDESRLLAAIDAKGQFTGSPVRRAFVENSLLMSRSVGGWGSEQMVRIASGQRDSRSRISRFFNMGAGGKKGPEGEP